MPVSKLARLFFGLATAVAMMGAAATADAQEKKIKIGVIYDLTGPFAGGGSELQYIGTKIMLDHYGKTGIEGYKVEAVYADAQSKPEVAINESVRLLEQEKREAEARARAAKEAENRGKRAPSGNQPIPYSVSPRLIDQSFLP